MALPEPQHRRTSALDELARVLASSTPGARVEIAAALQERAQTTLGPGLARHFARKLAAIGADEGDAAELCQRTWIEFWGALASGRHDPARARVSTFLYAVAQIVWMRELRRRGRETARVRTLEPGWEMPSEADGPDAAAELAAQVDAVRRVMQGQAGDLSAADRAVLRAIAEGATDREVASRLEVSPSTAHERKKAVLERLGSVLRGLVPRFGEDSGRAPGPKGAENRVKE